MSDEKIEGEGVGKFLEVVGAGISSARQLVEAFSSAPPPERAMLFAFVAVWCGKLAGFDREKLVEMFVSAISVAEHKGMADAMVEGITEPAKAQKVETDGNT